ncbi:DUF2157 domain-containing protein [Desulfosediminicola ganghwensis]|uniref:DUF2157 domain-containing protein n=1 Tax=Desulfosediminicola ganghwensis TaxID=2569540 RepID=UPI0010AD03D9|nr:DUF2157 domain-containing protein [Desulfosediminicola ganghwensis]
MKLNRKKLQEAVGAEILSNEQADRLWSFLEKHPTAGPRFDFTHVLYYMGGLTAIGAMTVFMTLGWENFGGWGIFGISMAYAVFGVIMANMFRSRGYHVPAAICATFTVAMTPLAIYGLQQAMGWWPDSTQYQDYHRYIRYHWLYMEFGTLVVGAVMAYVYRYPFLQMVIAATLWYLSMDLAAMIAGGRPDRELRANVSMWFGLANILFAFYVDFRSRKSADYSFWLYLAGVLAFWGGMTSLDSSSEVSRFFYFVINLLMIGFGVLISRRVFVIFGGIGCSFYLGHLAFSVFKASWLFPIALAAIGFVIIYLGVLWQKNEKKMTATMRSYLPDSLKEMLDNRSA